MGEACKEHEPTMSVISASAAGLWRSFSKDTDLFKHYQQCVQKATKNKIPSEGLEYGEPWQRKVRNASWPAGHMGEAKKLRGLWILSAKALNLVMRFKELRGGFVSSFLVLFSVLKDQLLLLLWNNCICAGIFQELCVHLGDLVAMHSLESALIDPGCT